MKGHERALSAWTLARHSTGFGPSISPQPARMAIVPFPPYVESHKPPKEKTVMEAARMLTREGFEIDTEREPARDRKEGDKLYLARKPEPEKADHAYT